MGRHDMSHDNETQDDTPTAAEPKLHPGAPPPTVLERTVFLPGTQRLRWLVLAAGFAGMGIGFGTGAAVFAHRVCQAPAAPTAMFSAPAPGAIEFHHYADPGVGWLGVSIHSNPVQVIKVLAGSPAEQAGLKSGDRILAIGTDKLEAVENAAEFVHLVRGFDPGTQVQLKICRAGGKMMLDATLGRRSHSEHFRSFVK
jgi:membrane-associated protease RseP (regulator of RpoE activity)